MGTKVKHDFWKLGVYEVALNFGYKAPSSDTSFNGLRKMWWMVKNRTLHLDPEENCASL